MNRQSTQDDKLATMPVTKLFWQLALPMTISQVVNLLYNMVDRIYIARIPETGTLALTALGLCFPIITLIMAFSYLSSAGAAPLASIALGSNDKERANLIMGNSFITLVLISIILTLIFLLFPTQILTFFGTNDETMPFALSYMRIYSLGTLFVQLTLGLNAFITAQGFSRNSMIAVIIGALSNIILDPIFIFILGFGVAGAAIATILSQALSAVYVLAFLKGNKTLLKLKTKYMKPDFKVISKSISLGLSPFIMISTESLLFLCFNIQLMKFGGTIAVGAMTILSSVMNFALMPLNGFTQGAQPIVSFNYGAGNTERTKNAFRVLLISCVVYSFSLWLLVMLFPNQIAMIFTSDTQLIDVCHWALRVYLFGCGLMGIQLACQQTFIALGKAKISIFLATLRKIILLIPFIFIFPMFISDKVLAVFLAEPVADIIAVLTTASLFFINFPKILQEKIHD